MDPKHSRVGGGGGGGGGGGEYRSKIYRVQYIVFWGSIKGTKQVKTMLCHLHRTLIRHL